MAKPTYAELADAYRKLHRAALNVSDRLRREVDHAVYVGSSAQADELQEAVTENFSRWNDFLYPSD